ncbi:MAG: hypothetical protein DCC73_11920 [Proteobacteria bacterium]|nr:MAG: hypothetical protein DCC73_11920 [Pseudomonadota bacterium]
MAKTTKTDPAAPEASPAPAAAPAPAATATTAKGARVRAVWTVKYGGKWQAEGSAFPVAAEHLDALLASGAVMLLKAGDDKGAA